VREDHGEAKELKQRDQPEEVDGIAVLLKDAVQNSVSIELIEAVVIGSVNEEPFREEVT
jgi:hypothetical protein